MTRPRRRKLFMAAGLLAMCLVGAEGLLQAARLVARGREGKEAKADPGAPVILCLGDSHTYGAGVDEAESYPSRLEGILRGRGYGVRVVNLGAPGTNTSQIRRRLPGLLDAYEPAAVVVLAGVNNGWNRRDAAWSDIEDGLAVPMSTRAGDWAANNVMLVRLAVVLMHRLDWTRPAEETSRDRGGNMVRHSKRADGEWEDAASSYRRARRDLVDIVSRARAAHAEPVLMTYVSEPDHDFATPNRLLREVAAEMNATLADNDKALRPLFIGEAGNVDRAARDRLFLPDMHPRGVGYGHIAENVAEALERSGALGAAGTGDE